MSVIFGIVENHEITIAGDKRGTSIKGGSPNDSINKVIMVNDQLAFAAAGNLAIATAIQMDINKSKNKEKITVDNLLDIIKAFYQKLSDNGATNILVYPFSFLIAGKNRNSEANLISGANIKGHLEAIEVPMALYPPEDVGNEECCNIFARNYHLYRLEFVEKTIRDISDLSKFVSVTGDKWVYNITKGKGLLHTF